MADKLEIIIGAKNLTGRAFRGVLGGLRGLASRVKRFGGGTIRAFGKMTRAVVGFGAALIGTGAIAVRAFTKQQDAEVALQSALKAHGDDVDALLPKLKQQASAIQEVTTAGDEEVLMLMATIRNLGIQGDALEKATKSAIGLATALNLDAESAARYAALAEQGEFTILQRYVPALRLATTEAEKNKIVQDLMSKGFQQAQDRAKTAGGSFKQMKNTIGDMVEEFGDAIVNTLNLQDGFNGLKNRVREFIKSGKVDEWAEKAKAALEPVKEILDAIFSGSEEERKLAIQGVKDIGGNLADSAIEKLKNAASDIGFKIGEAVENFMAKRKELQQEAVKELREEGEIGAVASKLPFFKALASPEFREKLGGKVRELRARESEGAMKSLLESNAKNLTVTGLAEQLRNVGGGNTGGISNDAMAIVDAVHQVPQGTAQALTAK
jgi:hypothetical protein